jgi:hypothetical protein
MFVSLNRKSVSCHTLALVLMVRSRIALVLAGVAAAAVVAGCNSDRSYAPPDTVLTDRQVSIDVANSVGEAIATDLQSLDDAASLSGVTFSINIDQARGDGQTTTSPCTYAAGRWSCAGVYANGLTFTRSYAYYDASGQPMQTLDNLKTASINYQLSVNGTYVRDTTFTGTTHRSRNVTVSGLLGAETTRRWDGYGASADTNTHHDAISTRRYTGKSTDSLKAVVYPQPRTHGSFPLSGSSIRTVNFTVTSTGRGIETRSVDRRVVTTYNGTALAKIQSGTVTCTLHLDTHQVDGCTG